MSGPIDVSYSDDGTEVVIESTDQRIVLSVEELQSLGVRSLEPNPGRVSEKVASKLNTDVLSEVERTPLEEQDVSRGGVRFRERVDARNAAMLDSTTFKNALGLLRGELDPSSFRFFDLKSFVNAVVLFDEVYVTSVTDVEEANDRLGDDVFEPIEPASPEEDDYLFFLWGETLSELESMSDERESELRQLWAQLLGVAEDEIAFDWSEADRWVHSPPEFYRNFDRRLPAPAHRDRFVSLSTFRTFYSHELARRLGLQYLPNSVRGPIEAHILSRVDEVAPQFDVVINEFERKLETDIQQATAGSPFLRESIQFRLPMFLSVVVNRADDLDDAFPTLADLRSEARPYRENAAELLAQIDRGNLDRIAELRRNLRDEADDLTEAFDAEGVDSTIEVAPDVPILPEAGSIEITGLKLLSGYTGDVFRQYGRRLYLRIRKPHYYFLSNVRQEARQFTSSKAAVTKLWGPEESIDFELIERAQEQYPYFT